MKICLCLVTVLNSTKEYTIRPHLCTSKYSQKGYPGFLAYRIL